MKIRFDVNDATGREALIGTLVGEALTSLDPNQRPHWGDFTALQMVEHLLQVFEISTGRITAACSTAEDWQIKARAFLHDRRPMPRGFQSPLLKEGPPPPRFETIRAATEALQAEARRFLDLSDSEPLSRRVHPVFGPCTVEEWSRMHFKHCVHHLLQFGLIEIEDANQPE